MLLNTDFSYKHIYVENDVEKLRRRGGKAKRPKTQSVVCAPKKLEKQGLTFKTVNFSLNFFSLFLKLGNISLKLLLSYGKGFKIELPRGSRWLSF